MKLLFLCLHIAAFCFSQNVQAFNCFEEIAIYHRTFSNGTPDNSEHHFRIRDKSNPNTYFYFNASIDPDDGSLYLDLKLRDPVTGERSALKGNQLYYLMMKHLDQSRIQSIQGIWGSGDNFVEFFDNVKRLGFDEETAAKATWSGRQAAKYGFTEIAEIAAEEAPIKGSPYVYVIFVRP